MNDLERARIRILNAKAEAIERRNAKARRQLVTIPEMETILRDLANQFLLIVRSSRIARARGEREIEDALKTLKQRIEIWRNEANG